MNLIYRRPGRRARRPARWITLLILCLGLVWAPAVYAGLVISVPTNIPVTPGAAPYSFDVTLTVTGTYNISAFQFTLDLPGASGVTFVAVEITSPGYIFPDSSGIGSSVENAGLTITAGDLELNPPGYVTLSDTTVSLGRVEFQVDPAAPGGTVPVTFDTSPIQTLVLDDAGTPLDCSTRSGSIVVAAAAVPEPSTLWMGVVGAIGAMIAWARRPDSRFSGGGRHPADRPRCRRAQ